MKKNENTVIKAKTQGAIHRLNILSIYSIKAKKNEWALRSVVSTW